MSGPQIPRPVGLPPAFAARVISSVPVSAPRIAQQIAPPGHDSLSPISARIAPVAPQGQVLPFRAPGVGPAAGASSGHASSASAPSGDSLGHYGAPTQTGTGYGSSGADASTGQPGGAAGASYADSSSSSAPASAGEVDDSAQPGGDAPGPMTNAPKGTPTAPKSNAAKYALIAAAIIAAGFAVWVLFIRKPKRKPNPFKAALRKASKRKGKRK